MTFIVLPLLISAKPQKITIACTIIGVPRNISMYADKMKSPIFLSTASALFFGVSRVRYMPIKRPINKPTIVPTIATSIV